MARYSDRTTRPLTLKYVFALALLAVLAITNFLLLRTEIQSGQAMASVLNNSGRQRMLLHRTAMLAGAQRGQVHFVPGCAKHPKGHPGKMDLSPLFKA